VSEPVPAGRGFDLRGVIDLHVHYGPAAVPSDVLIVHSLTAVEAAREAADAGLQAIVLKSKDYATAPLAHAVEEAVGGVRVFGGVVLDHAVGGINPVAVLQSLRMGAKVVWLPTNGSRQDTGRHGPPEYLRFASDEAKRGLAVIDDDGQLLPEVHHVFELVTEYDAVLATGHITLEEHLAVAREFGSSGRVLVTHCGARGGGPGLNAAQCAELAAYGPYMEFSGLTCIDHYGSGAMSMDEHAGMIRAVPPEQVVLSGDYGWDSDLPNPVAGMQLYLDQLLAYGFSEDELRLMACATPARLLGLGGF
jgi:Family of unknown function (DUF6282)